MQERKTSSQMLSTLSWKVIRCQVVVTCIGVAALLGLRVRTVQWTQQLNRSQVRALRHIIDCAQPDSHSQHSCGEHNEASPSPMHSEEEHLSVESVEENPPVDSIQEVLSDSPLERSHVPPKQVRGQHTNQPWVETHKHGDLPMLSGDRRPDSDSWDNSVSICACMLQENTTDVREWLMYHRWLGVDHVYLTENSDPAPSNQEEQLQDFIDEGFLTLEVDGRKANQLNIYKRCMEQHRHKHNWMAFIDIDEYIVLRKKQMSLKQFLDDFKYEAAVVIHWIVMGSSGHEHRPMHGGVLRHYHHCNREPTAYVKTIANNWFLANIADQVHQHEYRDNMLAVDEYGRTMAPRYPPPKACSNGSVPDPTDDIHCRPIPFVKKKKDEPCSVDHIVLYHYLVRSKEDFQIKLSRGAGDSTTRDKRYLKYIKNADRSAQDEGGVCGEPKKLADSCCPEDHLMLA